MPDRIGRLGNGPPRVPFATAGAELGRLRDAGAPTFKIMAAPREEGERGPIRSQQT